MGLLVGHEEKELLVVLEVPVVLDPGVSKTMQTKRRNFQQGAPDPFSEYLMVLRARHRSRRIRWVTAD